MDPYTDLMLDAPPDTTFPGLSTTGIRTSGLGNVGFIVIQSGATKGRMTGLGTGL